MKKSLLYSRRGIALMLVLWGLAIMSIAVVGLVEFVHFYLEEVGTRNKAFRALLMAESGMAIGFQPEIRKYDPLLRQSWGYGQSFEVKISDDSDRLPINYLLENPDVGRPVLERLFESWGIKEDKHRVIIDSLIDWVDSNDLKLLNGAEKNYYEDLGYINYPFNRKFLHIAEMGLVRGMALVAKKNPGWEKSFSIWAQGKINVNEVTAEMLEIYLRFTSVQAQRLIEWRNGKDGEPETADDRVFKEGDLSLIQGIAGVPKVYFDTISSNILFTSEFRRVVSTARSGGLEKTIEVLARNGQANRQYLEWEER